MIISIVLPNGATPEAASSLLDIAPRILIEARSVTSSSRAARNSAPASAVVWADARGLDAQRVANALLARIADWRSERAHNTAAGTCAGISRIPVVAEIAARALMADAQNSEAQRVLLVQRESEHRFNAPLPLALLADCCSTSTRSRQLEQLLDLM